MKTVLIKFAEGSAMMPRISTNGDWVDLYTSLEVTVKKGHYIEIPLGIAMKLPKGYEAIVAPRSSTFRRYGLLLANSIGIIDESYNGNTDYWVFPAYATEDVTIPCRTRICQFRIIKHQPKIKFTITKSLSKINRGGLGSTGL